MRGSIQISGMRSVAETPLGGGTPFRGVQQCFNMMNQSLITKS